MGGVGKVRSAVLVKLEEARNAKFHRRALEAKVSLYSSLPKLQSTLKAYVVAWLPRLQFRPALRCNASQMWR